MIDDNHGLSFFYHTENNSLYVFDISASYIKVR